MKSISVNSKHMLYLVNQISIFYSGCLKIVKIKWNYFLSRHSQELSSWNFVLDVVMPEGEKNWECN